MTLSPYHNKNYRPLSNQLNGCFKIQATSMKKGT